MYRGVNHTEIRVSRVLHEKCTIYHILNIRIIVKESGRMLSYIRLNIS